MSRKSLDSRQSFGAEWTQFILTCFSHSSILDRMATSADPGAGISPAVRAFAIDSDALDGRTTAWFALWNAREPANLGSIYHSEVRFFSPASGQIHGIDRLTSYFEELRLAFPKSTIIPISVSLLEPNFYMAKWDLLAREFASIHAPSSIVRLPGTTFLRFEDEKVVEEENLLDWWSLSAAATVQHGRSHESPERVESIIDSLNQAWNEADADKFCEWFSDASWFVDASQTGGVFGRDGIREYLVNLFAGCPGMKEELLGVFHVGTSSNEYVTRWRCTVPEPNGASVTSGCSHWLFNSMSQVVRMESIYCRGDILKKSGLIDKIVSESRQLLPTSFRFPGLA